MAGHGDDTGGILVMLGRLQEQVGNINKSLENHKNETRDEHRKVHDIVVATSEAVRNVNADVAEIKPIVKDYELKASYIDDTIVLAKEYRTERAEKEGARKLVVWLMGTLSLIGGAIAYFISTALEFMLKHKAVPVISKTYDYLFWIMQ